MMARLYVGTKTVEVSSGSNLLDALLAAGFAVPHSCRSGACQSCLLQCAGDLIEAKIDALSALQRAQGWRLACQSQVSGDVHIQPFGNAQQTMHGSVLGCDWLSSAVLRLRIMPEQRFRYSAGQYLQLSYRQVTRPYSLASVPAEDRWLEFHIDCSAPGAFSSQARSLSVGQSLELGTAIGGDLRYDPAWQDDDLWLLAAGTGLAPLWGVLRDALRQQHRGRIHLLHVGVPYLASAVNLLARQHAQLKVQLEGEDDGWKAWGRPLRSTRALLCGSPTRVERWQRALFMAGISRAHIITEAFSTQA